MCFTIGALCSPQRLLDYLGSLSNGYAPFQINYFLHSELEKDNSDYDDDSGPIRPHNPKVVPCHQEALPGNVT